MKARIMLDNASFEAEDLRIAHEAFDGAWKEIAARYDTNTVEGARERLAMLIISLVPATQDSAEIRAIAVQEMTKVR
jgi:hypothetical protein